MKNKKTLKIASFTTIAAVCAISGVFAINANTVSANTDEFHELGASIRVAEDKGIRFAFGLSAEMTGEGYEIGIVSWLSKSGTPEYNEEVRRAKRRWLATHLPSVDWDEVHMVRYGTPKWAVVQDQSGILFDDEEKNRRLWRGEAYEPADILEVLKSLF